MEIYAGHLKNGYGLDKYINFVVLIFLIFFVLVSLF